MERIKNGGNAQVLIRSSDIFRLKLGVTFKRYLTITLSPIEILYIFANSFSLYFFIKYYWFIIPTISDE